jgi:uncharacterized membrane protein
MTALTVWKFDTPEGAQRAEQVLVDLSKQKLIDIEDAATVSWPEGRKQPKTRQLTNLTKAGAGWGGLWGLLFGMLFFVPLLGLAIGAGMGALAGRFTDMGISDEFIKQVQLQVTPGTSALFLLSDNAVMDRIKPAMADLRPQLITTNLAEEQEQQLREVFAGSTAD